MTDLSNRTHSLFTSTVSGVKGGSPTILGQPLLDQAKNHSLAYLAGSLWLGQNLKSKKTEAVIDYALRLLVDHGPYVSGAVNTIITARAGRDLVSSLASGLLTIGPRFGGAVNGAARVWFDSVSADLPPAQVVEDFASRKEYISGIGHRKYRLDSPDPRVGELIKLMGKTDSPHLDFARAVESITTGKKPNLILNVDGCLAAILLDLLIKEEKLTPSEISTLIDAEFFNAIFVLSRSIGFIAHYLDQKRLGEPLFRLPADQVMTT
jgi:ATP citrate (pro-S)-lyase